MIRQIGIDGITGTEQMNIFSYIATAVRTLPMKGRRNILKIMTLGVGLAVGLIGYTIDEVRRRSKEIAVRRVNGAQFSQIRSMFLRDVMAVALPSVAVGAVLAYLVAGRWEQNFSLQAGLPWWIFVGSIVAVLTIVAIISDIYVIRTAGTNPADSIKTE